MTTAGYLLSDSHPNLLKRYNNIIKMLKKIVSYIFLTGLLLIMVCLFSPPSLVSAQGAAKTPTPSPTTATPPPEGIAPSGTASLSNLDPLRNAGGLQGLITNIFNIAYGAAGVIAVAYLIVGGYQYITSQGNPDATAVAKSTIINAIIGLIVILASYLIIRFALDQLRVGGLLG